MSLINREIIINSFKPAYHSWKQNEIMMSYYVSRSCFSLYNKTQTQQQMKLWRKLAKEGKIKIAEYNNKTKIINGVEHYILVVQAYDGGEFNESNSFDPMGIFILGEMVDGYIYLFKSKENRDKTYEYVMKGIQQPCGGYDGEDLVGLFGKKVEDGDEPENIIL